LIQDIKLGSDFFEIIALWLQGIEKPAVLRTDESIRDVPAWVSKDKKL